jgi:AcrR family transcriptional regulator
METLRDRRRVETRTAIIRAFLDLSHYGTGTVSMPDVAEEAGLSVRTVYRYFPTRSELHTAAANYFNDGVRSRLDADVSTANFTDYLTELWTDFQGELPAVVAEHATPAGRELRATRLPSARATVRRALEPIGDDSTDARVDEELVDLIVALTSSSMFLELVHRMGHEPKVAVAMVTRTIQPLIATNRSTSTQPEPEGEE